MRTIFLTIRFYILKTIAVDASIVEEEEEGEGGRGDAAPPCRHQGVGRRFPVPAVKKEVEGSYTPSPIEEEEEPLPSPSRRKRRTRRKQVLPWRRRKEETPRLLLAVAAKEEGCR